MEFRVIGLNINSTPPPKVNESNARALGVSKEFLENEFKDSIKKINRRDKNLNQSEVDIKLSPEENAILQSLDRDQMP